MSETPSRSHRMRWLAPVIAFAAPLSIYVATLPLGLTWAHDGADGGDLIAAASTLGVPHPPGYPLYTLLARIALLLPAGSPAHRVALLSAICGAGASLALFLAIREVAGRKRPGVALAVVLLWAFAPLAWGQSVIAEVYALGALLANGALALLLAWRRTQRAGYLIGAALFVGLGLAHQPTIAFVLVPAVLWCAARPPRPRIVLVAFAALLVGLPFLAYLPIAAARHPPVSWGNPNTLERLLWLVGAAPYRSLVFGLPLAEWPVRLAAFSAQLIAQFKIWGVLLGVFGFVRLWDRDRTLALGLALYGVVTSLFAVGYNTTDSYVYLLPVYAVIAIWIAVAVGGAVEWLTARSRAAQVLALVGLVALPFSSVAMNWHSADLHQDTAAQAYVDSAISVLPPNGIVLSDGDEPTFALWYARYALHTDFDGEVISIGLLQYDWYTEQLARRLRALPLSLSSMDRDSAVQELVGSLMATRPVFVTSREDCLLDTVRLTPTGPLFKVEPK